jgi:hypothetical protein
MLVLLGEANAETNERFMRVRRVFVVIPQL